MRKSRRSKTGTKTKRSQRKPPPMKKNKIIRSRRMKWPFLWPSQLEKRGCIQNLGGYLIAPPDTCTKRKSWEQKSIWVDLGNCINCEDKCSRLIWFEKASWRDRMNDLRSRNVRI